MAYSRLTGVLENEAQINSQIEMIKILNPKASICYILSPVPVNVIFADGESITRDCISKSTLRLPIESVVTKREQRDIKYFPSFEIVKWLATMNMKPIGQDDSNMAHVADTLVESIVHAFINRHQ